ncbi:MAG: Rrf2 family transcriptional regulator [Balneolaceae bacterium]|nr:Rrf2 family transcriptional regulator [Balneolaceae bacterium]
MLLSSACVYGLKASVYLAKGTEASYVSITKISEDLGISRHFLTKVLQQLTEAGIIESHKGPKGGVKLIQDSDDVYLLDIVTAIDGWDLFTECVLGLPGCGIEKPCPMHDKWAGTRDEIREMLEGTSLEDMVRKGKSGNLRITAGGNFKWT